MESGPMLMGDAFARPLQELRGLIGGEVLFHLKEMGDREILQRALGGVDLGEGGVDRAPIRWRGTEGVGEFVPGGFESGEEIRAVPSVGRFDRLKPGLLLKRDRKFLVEPIVEVVSSFRSRGGSVGVLVILCRGREATESLEI